jgi:hypothetical protein
MFRRKGTEKMTQGTDVGSPFGPCYGESENVRECNATLRLVGPNVVPSEITKLLGVEPSRAFAMGETYVSKAGHTLTTPIGAWHWVSDDIQSTSLERHCEHLIETFAGKANLLSAISIDRSVTVSVVIWYGPAEYPGGFDLKSSTVASLCALCENISFHLLWAPDEES